MYSPQKAVRLALYVVIGPRLFGLQKLARHWVGDSAPSVHVERVNERRQTVRLPNDTWTVSAAESAVVMRISNGRASAIG